MAGEKTGQVWPAGSANVPVASAPWSQSLLPSVFLGPLVVGEVQGQRPGPGLPDQSLKCQTYLGLAEFSHVSHSILPRTVDESTVFLQVFPGAEG